MVINDISIGSALQQLTSQKQTNGKTSVFMLSLSYAFSSDDENKSGI
ncbi:hypothetical protein [Fluviispira vulneris]|nr:hypothetical protein [Fluviispira vulneris]